MLFAKTLEHIQQQLAQDSYVGVQLYISLKGDVLLDTALGQATPTTPMQQDTVMLWFSSGKPITAVAVAKQYERNLLDLDDKVSLFIPEFAQHNKADITIRHLLTHTGGFLREWHWQNYLNQPWQDIIKMICQAPLESNWHVGEDAGYHPASSWFVLGEIIRRVDGRDYARFVREEIFEPLGMTNCWLGILPETDILSLDLGTMYNTSRELPAPYPHAVFDSQAALEWCNPGERARGPIRELAILYECLLAQGKHAGHSFLQPDTVQTLTTAHSHSIRDKTIGQAVDWGLGFAINSPASSDYRYFGESFSPSTFGHGGYQSSLAFADPEVGLTVALLLNGTRPGRRCHEIAQSIWQELFG
ncbi:MAG: serine hydrolase domain-containing protein [Deinococcota bacterium]